MINYKDLTNFEKQEFNNLEDEFLRCSGDVKTLLLEKYVNLVLMIQCSQ